MKAVVEYLQIPSDIFFWLQGKLVLSQAMLVITLYTLSLNESYQSVEKDLCTHCLASQTKNVIKDKMACFSNRIVLVQSIVSVE